MYQIRIFSALVILALLILQVSPVKADNGQKLLLKKSFSTESGERLKVNGCAGDLKVDSWLKNEVEVKIYGNPEALKYLDFNVNSDELGINICALKKAGIEKVKNLNLRYEITVPRDYNVKVSTSGKNVNIEDQTGAVQISSLGNIGSGP